MPSAKILTVNGGSSSIKFALYSRETSRSAPEGVPLQKILYGAIGGIGSENSKFHVNHIGSSRTEDSFSRPISAPRFATAVDIFLKWLSELHESQGLYAIGHRVVHGGPVFSAPQILSKAVISELRALSSFDPEHLPGELLLIEALHEKFSDLQQVACFDTDFHRDLPQVARLLAIPRRYEKKGLRRYGFHGLSYAFLLEELARLDQHTARTGKVVLAHLGNGASLAALDSGKSVDTSMGFTPASGVPMSTRSGDLDPGVMWYLARTEGLDAKGFNEMINFKSGLLGISEISSDMRVLLETEAREPQAAEAITFFSYQIRKNLGAFAAALGGLDTVVFSGGIGENAPTVRQRICENLQFLGIELDLNKNLQNAAVISTTGSRVVVRVIRTDEESIIATIVSRTLELLKKEN